MPKDNRTPEQPRDDSWLDEVLGVQTPKEATDRELIEQLQAPPKPAFEVPEELSLDESVFEASPKPEETVDAQTPIEEILGETDNPLDRVTDETRQVPDLPVTPVIDPALVPLTQHTDARVVEEETSATPAKGKVTEKSKKAPRKDPNAFCEAVPDVEPPMPPRKIRPKRKKGYGFLGIPHILVTFVWLFVILVVGVSFGRLLWVCCADLMAFGKPDMEVVITITDEEVKIIDDETKEVDIDAIAKKMADAGLIEYPDLFKVFATVTGKDKDIIAGTFTLNSYFDYNAMINQMSYYAPARDEVTVLIPEGYTCAQIFRLLEEEGVCTAEDLEEYAAHGELEDYWFLESVERGSKYCLEGFLFPDTYDFYTNDDPKRVLEKFLDDFDYRFTDLMMEDYYALRERYGLDLSVRDVVILASIVEKETASADESYNIASVFYNRLSDPNFYPRFLGSDATVHYAIGDYYGDIRELTQAHLDSVSPYNTRKYEGLPPGPICSPGRDSLYAALDPNSTGYLYFVYDPEVGRHLFASTLYEHQINVQSVG